MHDQSKQLETQSSKLSDQSAQLIDQSTKLKQQSVQLIEQTVQLESQSIKLEQQLSASAKHSDQMETIIRMLAGNQDRKHDESAFSTPPPSKKLNQSASPQKRQTRSASLAAITKIANKSP